jgi:hypothetical protein
MIDKDVIPLMICNLERTSIGIKRPIFRTTCSFKNTRKAGYAISALDPETAKVLVGYLSD